MHNRDELLDAVTERFVSGLRLPAGGQHWPDWVRAVATELRSQLIEHPGLAELVLARAGATATGPTVLARFLDELESHGLDRAVAHVAWHASSPSSLAPSNRNVPAAQAANSPSEQCSTSPSPDCAPQPNNRRRQRRSPYSTPTPRREQAVNRAGGDVWQQPPINARWPSCSARRFARARSRR